jgi:hypothetical protein
MVLKLEVWEKPADLGRAGEIVLDLDMEVMLRKEDGRGRNERLDVARRRLRVDRAIEYCNVEEKMLMLWERFTEPMDVGRKCTEVS